MFTIVRIIKHLFDINYENLTNLGEDIFRISAHEPILFDVKKNKIVP